MSLRKLCLFALAATLAGFAAVETLNVQIKEYDVPTPRSRPHDPALAPDGSLWYTGQGANKLGRLDPKSGEFKEYPLKTADSGPHGLVADKDGNIWFTAISGGYVGKLDPKTGEISEYRPSDGAKIDPHTPVFDHNGILWFTNEETNYIGRLDPKTGKMILTKSPTPHAVPYGIVVTQNDLPFFCEFGTNKLASIDPNTMKIREYTLPAAGARPRRIAFKYSALPSWRCLRQVCQSQTVSTEGFTPGDGAQFLCSPQTSRRSARLLHRLAAPPFGAPTRYSCRYSDIRPSLGHLLSD
jgi:streptogramin lyase